MTCLTRLLTISLFVLAASQVQGAKLVVLAIDSGSLNPPVNGSRPPVVPFGAKGFLIGVANNTPQDVTSPLAFQDMTFSGPNLVQRVAPNSAALEFIESPNVQRRSDALFANVGDPVAESTFAANDSWWWNQSQTVNGQSLTLAPVSTGIQGGLPGGPMSYTASYNPSGNVEMGVWRMAYIVATGDVNISGILAAGPAGKLGYDLTTGAALPNPNHGSQAVLRFSDGQIVVPEPGTFVLFALGLLGFVVHVVRRRG